LCRVSRIRDFDIETESPYSLGATVSVFLLWGLAASTPVLCIFSLMYGLFAGGFSAGFPGITKAVKRRAQMPTPGLFLVSLLRVGALMLWFLCRFVRG
jgi:hypothetical protein